MYVIRATPDKPEAPESEDVIIGEFRSCWYAVRIVTARLEDGARLPEGPIRRFGFTRLLTGLIDFLCLFSIRMGVTRHAAFL